MLDSETLAYNREAKEKMKQLEQFPAKYITFIPGIQGGKCPKPREYLGMSTYALGVRFYKCNNDSKLGNSYIYLLKKHI